MLSDDRDDIDILFARMERVPAPPGFGARVLAAVESRTRARRRLGITALAASLLVATVLSFFIGQELQTTDALEILAGALDDVALLSTEPSDVALAFIELAPWPLAALVGVCLAVAAGASRLALTSFGGLGPRGAGH